MASERKTILGVDPGPTTSGVVHYDLTNRRVLRAWKAATRAELREIIVCSDFHQVVVEEVSAGPHSSASLLETQKVVGMVEGWCDILCLKCDTYYRRDVLRALDYPGRGNRDSFVRATLIERHGGSNAIGRKATPGPLYGVSSHAWQALGVVFAHAFPWRGTDDE